MTDFDTLKAYIPPINVVPGSTLSRDTTNQIGAGAAGSDYIVEKDGWYVNIEDPGKLTDSSKDSGPFYSFAGTHRSVIEWSPYARMDMALTPVGQDVAEGKSFEAFHSEYVAEAITTGGDTATFPGWNGVVCKVIDMWSSEEIADNMISQLGYNGWFPGTEPGWPIDVYSSLNAPTQNPANIEHKLRLDQVISARYREMVSTSNAPTSQYFGGQLMTVVDHTIGGNSAMSDQIHHLRWVYIVASNNGDHNIASPAGTGSSASSRYNYAKVGFFVPAAIDTLTIGIDKVESDAVWATLARRGATR